MKTPVIVIGFAVALLIGTAAGYSFGLRKGLEGAYKRTVDDELSAEIFSWMREARTCLGMLQAFDSRKPEDAASVRRHGLITIRMYVSSVQDMRRSDPNWGPKVPLEVYTNATAYLAGHGETQPPNNARP